MLTSVILFLGMFTTIYSSVLPLMRSLISCLRSVHQILFQRLRAETCHTIHLKRLPMICRMELVELPMGKIVMAQ